MAQKAEISSASPRSVGSIPAAFNTASAAPDPPYMDESAERSILRRWAKAKSIIANTFLRSSSSPGVARRVNLTSLESTFGCGQKILRDTEQVDRQLLLAPSQLRFAAKEESPVGEEIQEQRHYMAS